MAPAKDGGRRAFIARKSLTAPGAADSGVVTVFALEMNWPRRGSAPTHPHMSASRDPRMDAYIANAAPFAQPILTRLRKLVHQACPEVEEAMKWSMPSFGYRGKILCHMAAFKAHCAFGFWHEGMAAIVKSERANAEPAMGGFGRITAVSDLPADKTLLGYIRHAMRLTDSGAPGRGGAPGKAAKKELPVPDELAAALKKNKAAAKTFAELPPSGRKEYITWIAEAKREETREQRLATTVEWLAEGKARYWKYEKC